MRKQDLLLLVIEKEESLYKKYKGSLLLLSSVRYKISYNESLNMHDFNLLFFYFKEQNIEEFKRNQEQEIRLEIYRLNHILMNMITKKWRKLVLNDMECLYLKLKETSGTSYIVENMIEKEKKWLNELVDYSKSSNSY